MHESYINLDFNPPSNFFAVRQQQLFELKQKNFNDMSNNESISNTFAQRHYLDYSDGKISENMEWLRKDAALKWELNQIENNGPNWREHIEAAENVANGTSSGGESGGNEGGGTAASSEIPEFGGGATPETPETETTPETPEAGTAPAAETPETAVPATEA
jgi:hypothetical protein